MIRGCDLLKVELVNSSKFFRNEVYFVVSAVTGGRKMFFKTDTLRGIRGSGLVEFGPGECSLLTDVDLGDSPHVVGCIEVWESDEDWRVAGERIGKALDSVSSSVVDQLLDFAGLAFARSAITTASSVLCQLLTGAKDDRLAIIHFEMDSPEELLPETRYELKSKNVHFELMVTGPNKIPELVGNVYDYVCSKFPWGTDFETILTSLGYEPELLERSLQWLVDGGFVDCLGHFRYVLTPYGESRMGSDSTEIR